MGAKEDAVKVIIDRATWNCGRGICGENMLLNSQGQRCCLGFLGEAVGLDDENAYSELPSEVRGDAQWPGALFRGAPHTRIHRNALNEPVHVPTEWEGVFAELNDKADVDHATRESWISAGFRIVLGCDVEFVGEYP